MTAVDDVFSEAMKVPILLPSVSDISDYIAVCASFNTMQDVDATWNYVTTTFREEQPAEHSRRIMGIKQRAHDGMMAAAISVPHE